MHVYRTAVHDFRKRFLKGRAGPFQLGEPGSPKARLDFAPSDSDSREELSIRGMVAVRFEEFREARFGWANLIEPFSVPEFAPL